MQLPEAPLVRETTSAVVAAAEWLQCYTAHTTFDTAKTTAIPTQMSKQSGTRGERWGKIDQSPVNSTAKFQCLNLTLKFEKLLNQI